MLTPVIIIEAISEGSGRVWGRPEAVESRGLRRGQRADLEGAEHR